MPNHHTDPIKDKDAPIDVDPDQKLFVIISKGGEQEILNYLNQRPQSAKAIGQIGDSSLHAVVKGPLKSTIVCERLISLGVDIHARNMFGESVLQCAAAHGFEEGIELCLKHGALINESNTGGWSPAHYAVVNNKLDTLKLLQAKGADLHHQDAIGCNLLHRALIDCGREDAKEMILRLIEQEVSLETVNEWGKSPLGHLDHDPLKDWVIEVKLALTEKKALTALQEKQPVNHHQVAPRKTITI